MPTIPIKVDKGVNKDLLPSELGDGWLSDALNFQSGLPINGASKMLIKVVGCNFSTFGEDDEACSFAGVPAGRVQFGAENGHGRALHHSCDPRRRDGRHGARLCGLDLWPVKRAGREVQRRPKINAPTPHQTRCGGFFNARSAEGVSK